MCTRVIEKRTHGDQKLTRSVLEFGLLGGWKMTRRAGSFSDPVRWATFGPKGPRQPRFSRFSGSVSNPVFWVSFRPRNHFYELEGRKMTQKTGLETDRENLGCPIAAEALSLPPRGPLPTPARGHVPNPRGVGSLLPRGIM